MNTFHPKNKNLFSTIFIIDLLFELDLFYRQFLLDKLGNVYKEALVAK
jgi:hypothetical protein